MTGLIIVGVLAAAGILACHLETRRFERACRDQRGPDAAQPVPYLPAETWDEWEREMAEGSGL